MYHLLLWIKFRIRDENPFELAKQILTQKRINANMLVDVFKIVNKGYITVGSSSPLKLSTQPLYSNNKICNQ